MSRIHIHRGRTPPKDPIISLVGSSQHVVHRSMHWSIGLNFSTLLTLDYDNLLITFYPIQKVLPFFIWELVLCMGPGRNLLFTNLFCFSRHMGESDRQSNVFCNVLLLCSVSTRIHIKHMSNSLSR